MEKKIENIVIGPIYINENLWALIFSPSEPILFIILILINVLQSDSSSRGLFVCYFFDPLINRDDEIIRKEFGIEEFIDVFPNYCGL